MNPRITLWSLILWSFSLQVVSADFGEKDAAKLIPKLGGWCEFGSAGHIVEVRLSRVENETLGVDQKHQDPRAVLKLLPFCKKLQTLSLGGFRIGDDDLEFLSGLRDLSDLSLDRCTEITDNGVAHLANCENLESLKITASQITDDSLIVFGRLKKLKRLSLQDSPGLTDEGLAALAQLLRLEELSLTGRGSQITGSGFEYLIDLPIRTLGIGHCPIKDDGAAQIARMANLETLWAKRTRMTDTGIAYLVGLPLRELALLGTRLTDEGAMHLSRISTLERLWVGGTDLTDASMSSLGRLHELRAIALPRGITESGRRELSAALPEAVVSFWIDPMINGKHFWVMINRESEQWACYQSSSKPLYTGALPSALSDEELTDYVQQKISAKSAQN